VAPSGRSLKLTPLRSLSARSAALALRFGVDDALRLTVMLPIGDPGSAKERSE
jgi:hypothetical protein